MKQCKRCGAQLADNAEMCRSGGMADAQDSKSCVGDYVWVQVPSPAL